MGVLGYIRRLLWRADLGIRPATNAAKGQKRGSVPARPVDGHPAGRTFRNIVVMPGSPNQTFLTLVNGGPIWPRFEEQTKVRAMRRRKPVDFRPAEPTGPVRRVDEPCVWGGMLFMQFGHLCAEFTTRLLWSRLRWPDATYLFIASPVYSESNLPAHCWSIFEWLGLRRDQVRIVTAPLECSVLHVMPQAETLHGPPPTEAYLDLMDANARRNGLVPVASNILYVTRVGMLAAQSGANAGESYLQTLLSEAGVTIMDPAVAGFREQMERYAGAATIVFAEGSAVHGLQLLGRTDHRVFVLNRRMKNDLGHQSLKPRVREVRYFKTTKALVKLHLKSGKDMQHTGVSFYDTAVVFEVGRALGIDLDTMWNDDAYRAAQGIDVQIWLTRLRSDNDEILRDDTIAALRPIFLAEGLGHLIPKEETAE
jgi:hypothetical protein